MKKGAILQNTGESLLSFFVQLGFIGPWLCAFVRRKRTQTGIEETIKAAVAAITGGVRLCQGLGMLRFQLQQGRSRRDS